MTSEAEEQLVQNVVSVKPTFSQTIHAPISCLAFSPGHVSLFILGTYELQDSKIQGSDDKSQTRTGSLCVFSVVDDAFVNHHILQTDYGVLDLGFSTDKEQTLAVATSVGKVEIFRLTVNNLIELQRIQSYQVIDESLLVLQLAWNPHHPHHHEIALALSDGRIAILDRTKRSRGVRFISAHSLEAWYVAWSQQPHIIYSGGDDSCFCISNVDFHSKDSEDAVDNHELEKDETDDFTPLLRNSKLHEAGVTAILPLGRVSDNSCIVLTGSYDEKLRVVTHQLQPTVFKLLVEISLGGGVWRLKPILCPGHSESMIHPGVKFLVLASCMHAGPKIIEIQYSSVSSWSVKVLAEMVEHDSMNYASDIMCDAVQNTPPRSYVSSSFYDKKLCLWHFEESENIA